MDFKPLVSIVIPVYNGSKYMREAIDSALAQTYDNIEIVVVNDGSSDNTEEIALSYGDKIRYFYKENGGQSTALNLGIEKMKGEYFSWLSHDDVYYPEKVEKNLDVIRNYKNEKIIVYSNFDIINNNSELIGEGVTKNTSPEQFRLQLLLSAPINGCTALIPKSAFIEIGFFNEKMPHTSDVELFFDLAAKFQFVHQAVKLVQSRVHSQQMTHKKPRYHNHESNLFLIHSLAKMNKADFEKLSVDYPNIFLQIAQNWASRGYYKAYKTAINKYRKVAAARFTFLFVNTVLSSNLVYLKKVIKSNLKYFIFSFKKW